MPGAESSKARVYSCCRRAKIRPSRRGHDSAVAHHDDGLATLARFSEAFLILRVQVAVSAALVPVVLIIMNVVYALMAYPAGVISDGGDRIRPLALGIVFLIAADLLMALSDNLAVSHPA